MNAIPQISHGVPITSGAYLDDLELADDFAHTSGRAKQLERASRDRQPDPAERIADCRMRMEMYRHTASVMAKVIRWFRHAPHDALCGTVYGPISLNTARSELKHARCLNHRVAGQLGEWIRRAEAKPASFLIAAE